MQVRNVQHNSQGTVDCEINHPTYGWIPFTASPDDGEEFGKNLYKELKEGKHGVIKPFEPYVPSTEYLELEARGKRDGLLQELDAVVSNPMRWEDLSKVQKGELRDYRTLLLDVPQQLTFPETIHWPTKPTYL